MPKGGGGGTHPTSGGKSRMKSRRSSATKSKLTKMGAKGKAKKKR